MSKIPAALLVGLAPFFFHFRTSSSTSHTVNGEVVEQISHTMDYVAVALGPIVAARNGPAATRTRSMVLAVIGILFGALQILRGVSSVRGTLRISAAALALALLAPAAFAKSVTKQPVPSPVAAPLPPPSEPPPEPQKDASVVLPAGSGDYSKMLAAVVRYKKGELSFEQLKKLVVAAKLPPHHLGCGYLIMPVPAPPPGVPFNPALMPRDWENTFGEVTMTYWAGKITREEYDRLHDAAHHGRHGFPSCTP